MASPIYNGGVIVGYTSDSTPGVVHDIAQGYTSQTGVGTLTTIPKVTPQPVAGAPTYTPATAPVTYTPAANGAALPKSSGLSDKDALAVYNAGIKGGLSPTAAAAVVQKSNPTFAIPGSTPTPTTPAVPTYPTVPTYTPSSATSNITTAYNDLLGSISSIESRILSAATPTDEEKQLQQELAAKKDQLAKFDIGSLQATENLYGTGAGRALGTIGTENTTIQRTRALERLGLAQEADTLTNSLSMAQSNRQQLGELAQTEYNLAKSKLDIAMNVQNEMTKLHDDEQDRARQYLLDVVDFAQGKTFDQLDPESQAAITTAVANSPITLGMVKTALQSGFDKAQAADEGRLFQVSGLGVVQVNKDGSGYKVVVPSSGTPPSPTGSPPTFEQYVANQNLPFPTLTQDKLTQLRAEYDSKYGSVNKTSFTPSQLNNGAQNAGLSVSDFKAQPYDVQNFYASAPDGQITALNKELAGVANGTIKLADAKAWVNGSQITPTMKQYLNAKFDAIHPATQTSGGGGILNSVGNALGSGWNAITSFFGI